MNMNVNAIEGYTGKRPSLYPKTYSRAENANMKIPLKPG